jgi:hypothetical protein
MGEMKTQIGEMKRQMLGMESKFESRFTALEVMMADMMAAIKEPRCVPGVHVRASAYQSCSAQARMGAHTGYRM